LFAEQVRSVAPGGAGGAAGVGFQDAAGARALVSERGMEEARGLVRRRHGGRLDAVAGAVGEALVWRADGTEPEPGELVDAGAVRLYLAGDGPDVDRALRVGAGGEELAFARCVAAGVGRLPAYRGAACVVAELSAAELRAVRERGVLVERGFGHALSELPSELPGNVDVLIWSMTARRTRLLEPDGEHYVDGRVVFLPGTGFKVLDAQEATPNHRGRLLLREVAPDEPDQEHGPFDDLALASLHRYLAQRAASYRRVRVGPAAVDRLTWVPGLTMTRGGESGGYRLPGESAAVG
jgi:hypothetical protein